MEPGATRWRVELEDQGPSVQLSCSYYANTFRVMDGVVLYKTFASAVAHVGDERLNVESERERDDAPSAYIARLAVLAGA